MAESVPDRALAESSRSNRLDTSHGCAMVASRIIHAENGEHAQIQQPWVHAVCRCTHHRGHRWRVSRDSASRASALSRNSATSGAADLDLLPSLSSVLLARDADAAHAASLMLALHGRCGDGDVAGRPWPRPWPVQTNDFFGAGAGRHRFVFCSRCCNSSFSASASEAPSPPQNSRSLTSLNMSIGVPIKLLHGASRGFCGFISLRGPCMRARERSALHLSRILTFVVRRRVFQRPFRPVRGSRTHCHNRAQDG